MTKSLTLGTAKVLKTDLGYEVEFMREGSFMIGRQIFGGDFRGALRFIRLAGLRVIDCEC